MGTGSWAEEGELLAQGAVAMELELSAGQTERLIAYGKMLAAFNDTVRLVAEAAPDVIVRKHLLDALSCTKAGRIGRATTLVDVGSGGGLPGIPLAIVLGCRVLLVEPNRKKAQFLEHVVESLGLTEVEVLRARAEELARGELREAADCAVSRALASLPVVLEYCLPLVKIGGCAMAQKGAPAASEVENGRAAAEVLGSDSMEIVPLDVEGLVGGRRCLVVCAKTRLTPGAFPRKPGIARKRPLGSA